MIRHSDDHHNAAMKIAHFSAKSIIFYAIYRRGPLSTPEIQHELLKNEIDLDDVQLYIMISKLVQEKYIVKSTHDDQYRVSFGGHIFGDSGNYQEDLKPSAFKLYRLPDIKEQTEQERRRSAALNWLAGAGLAGVFIWEIFRFFFG